MHMILSTGFFYDTIWAFIYAFLVGLVLLAVFMGSSLSPPAMVFVAGLFACLTLMLS